MKTSTSSTECLNGITLLRFTHAFKSGGGVENYLKDCNRILLERNSMTIIQIFYADENAEYTESQQLTGKGKLINIAVPRTNRYHGESVKSYTEQALTNKIFQFARNHVLNNSICQKLIKSIKYGNNIRISSLSAEDALKLFNHLFTSYNIDLISLHCIGTDDTSRVIDLAIARNIPFFYLNHYSNNKFNDIHIKKQLPFAKGIAGVSSCSVPGSLRKRFVSLYDGIDTSYFSRENASPVHLPHCNGPVVFLPARICEGKGHIDLIKAVILLKKEHIPVHILFTGRIDSSEFNSQLHLMIEQNQLSNSVTFFDHCNSDEIRNMYALSSIVVLPSKNEGLGRILIEAQSMSVPVVAYNVGGSSQSLLHGKSGFLCKPGDINGLKETIKKILTDPTLRKSLGEAGRNFVLQEFTLDHLAFRHEIYYHNILKQHKSSLLKLRTAY